jgi:hypothetical protein
MTRRLAAAAVALLGLGGGARPAAAQEGALDLLLAEVRLLRQAIERQNASATRIQLVIGRLTLQDQRVARSRAAVERLEGELAGATLERNNLRNALTERQRAVEQVTDPNARAQLEQSFRSLQSNLRDREARLQDLQRRLTEGQQVLETETARFDELEAGAGQLEREIDRGER